MVFSPKMDCTNEPSVRMNCLVFPETEYSQPIKPSIVLDASSFRTCLIFFFFLFFLLRQSTISPLFTKKNNHHHYYTSVTYNLASFDEKNTRGRCFQCTQHIDLMLSEFRVRRITHHLALSLLCGSRETETTNEGGLLFHRSTDVCPFC